MVTDIVQTAICTMDGIEFTNPAACPACGGPVQGYDTRSKKFAIVREGESERLITIRVKRFTCRHCGSLCNADEPFYPDTRLGSLVVDLFVTFTSIMPPNQAARIIDAMGIVVNRTSWRNYAGMSLPDIPATVFFGMKLPVSILTLSTLAARSPGGDRIKGAEVLAACGFPSGFRPVPLPSPSGKIGEGIVACDIGQEINAKGDLQRHNPLEKE
jgi:hypothetical protein